MAAVRIAREIVEDALFGCAEHPVTIRSVEMNALGELVFQIDGEDVPNNVNAVQALCHVQQNRAGQRLVTMRFERLH